MKFFLCLLMSTWLTGCQAAQYQDDSISEKYAELVGGAYKTLDDLIVHGVTYDRNYKKVLSEYLVTNKPGFGGPEVLSSATLKAGAVIRVNRVTRCTSCVYSSIKYEIEIIQPHMDTTVPISLTAIGGEKMAVEKNDRLMMNPAFFRPQQEK